MIRNKDIDIDDIHYFEHDGTHREITYVYFRGIKVWELIIGFLFSKDDYSLQSKDKFILKAKNQ